MQDEQASFGLFSCLRRTRSHDDLGLAKGRTLSWEIRPVAGLKTGDFAEEKLEGGTTVERFFGPPNYPRNVGRNV